METEFPLEFLVSGTPVSLQSSNRPAIDGWKALIRESSRRLLPEGHWTTERPISVTFFYFPVEQMEGDLDNIVKFMLDALSNYIYADDRQVERVVIQKFEPERLFSFAAPSEVLANALFGPKPVVYIRLSDDPFEELE
jgi:crossover junction endodeoxyribonuclease RusA